MLLVVLVPLSLPAAQLRAQATHCIVNRARHPQMTVPATSLELADAAVRVHAAAAAFGSAHEQAAIEYTKKFLTPGANDAESLLDSQVDHELYLHLNRATPRA